MKLITEKGPCDTDLRKACIGIAIFFLVYMTIGVIILPGTLTHSSTLIGFIINLVGNIALLIGCLKYNQWLVLVWLIQEVLFFIGWPIAVFGVIFHFGGYREAAGSSSIIAILIGLIISLVLHIFCVRLVYSYFDQLRNRQSTPQHAVVV